MLVSRRCGWCGVSDDRGNVEGRRISGRLPTAACGCSHCPRQTRSPRLVGKHLPQRPHRSQRLRLPRQTRRPRLAGKHLPQRPHRSQRLHPLSQTRNPGQAGRDLPHRQVLKWHFETIDVLKRHSTIKQNQTGHSEIRLWVPERGRRGDGGGAGAHRVAGGKAK